MQTLNALKSFAGKRLANYPAINHTNLFKRIAANFHFELILKDEKFLISPIYTLLRGEAVPELVDFIGANEEFLDSLKEFILNSLYIYSALIEENSYYLCHEDDLIIARLIHRRQVEFEVKFYSHLQEELLNFYSDKIYIGRIFVNLHKFEKEKFGLNEYFLSIKEQNDKIQERAHHKLRYYDDYKKSDLDEIDYLSKEVAGEALERLKLFSPKAVKSIPTIELNEMLDHILYIQNLMIELRDCATEFETKLRLREENNFVKHLTKFSKDLVNDIKYLTKLFYLISLKISKFSPI